MRTRWTGASALNAPTCRAQRRPLDRAAAADARNVVANQPCLAAARCLLRAKPGAGRTAESAKAAQVVEAAHGV